MNDEQVQALGQIVVAWGDLELLAALVLTRILNTNADYGLIMAANLPFAKVLDVIVSSVLPVAKGRGTDQGDPQPPRTLASISISCSYC